MAWQPFFEKRPTDLAAQATFLGHVQTLDSLGRRRWDRGAWRDELAAVPDSAPGPDGLCYSFWSRTPCDWTSLIFGLAERLADASDPPGWLLDRVAIFIPKGEAATTSDSLTLATSELRPITLMQGQRHCTQHFRIRGQAV